MRGDKPLVLEDRCIDCGECIRVCSENAIKPNISSYIDLTRYEYTLAVPSSPLLVQFQHDVGPQDVCNALLKLGFDEVVSMDRACEVYMVALARRILSHHGQGPYITAQCPTIVRVIQTLYPDLLDHLVPLVSPRELAARWARERVVSQTGLAQEKIGVVYITPCPSKLVDIEAHLGPDESAIDAVIPITDIYHEILTAISKMRRKGQLTREAGSSVSIAWAILGGMSRNQRRAVHWLQARLPQGDSRKAINVDFLPVAQVSSVRDLFEEIEKGRLRNVDLVECMACPTGCVGGSLVVDNPYVARSKAIELLRKLPKPEDATDWSLVERAMERGDTEPREAIRPTPIAPLDGDLRKSLEKMQRKEELAATLPGIDCGACGSPTCRDLAEDIVREMAQLSDCLVLKAKGYAF